MNAILQIYKRYRNFILYGVIGASGAVLDFLVFLVLYNIFHINPLLSTAISTTFGIVNNFILNILFNFKVRDKIHKRFALFYIVGISGLLLSVLIIYIVHDLLGINANIAKLVSIPVVVIFQYVLNSKVSFATNLKRPIPKLRKLSFSQVGSRLSAVFGGIRHLTFNRHTGFRFLCILLVPILYLLFMRHATYLGFSDEYDNILGGLLMSHHGTVVYRDMFSHHMPLPYFIGAMITAVTSNDLNAFRFVFVSALFLWTMGIARRVGKLFNARVGLLFVVLVISVQYMTWAHLLLAETLIAYAVTHMIFLALDLYQTKRKLDLKTIIVLGTLSAVPILSALPFAFVSLSFYFVIIFLYLRNNMSGRLTKAQMVVCLRDSFILAIPYLALGTYLFMNGAVTPFINQAYRFNKLYYSQFVPDVSSGSILQNIYSSLLNMFGNLSQTLGLSNAPTGALPIAILALIFTLLTLLYFVIKRQYTIGMFLLMCFVAISMRSNVFSELFANHGNNRLSAAYAFFIVTLATIVLGRTQIPGQLNKKTNDETELVSAVRIGTILLGVFVVVALVISGLQLDRQISYIKKHGVETGLQLGSSSLNKASIVNAVTNKNDYYWVGPFDFYSQLYISANRSSIYTFFAPWQGICKQCNQQLLSGYSNQKPKVIYWAPHMVLLGVDTDSATQSVKRYLEENYYTYDSNEQLANFHFLKQDQVKIEDRLRTNGYLNTNN